MRILPTAVESDAALSRRRILTTGSAFGLAWSLLPRELLAPTSNTLSISLEVEDCKNDRVRGLIYGGVLGDALGGPVEFQEGPAIDAVLPRLRRWPDDRKWDEAVREQLASSLKLLSYQGLRLSAESYAQWSREAPAGTTNRGLTSPARLFANSAKNPTFHRRANSL